ncbi:hypothetical protein ABZX92_38475 [Lentzea sp. NPDC006480]|uniref:hypothetical protein n=1 Tax=Lentzea sp. NPDC006480 TaxID=3157176 RepID=UPI0033BB7B1C
MKFADISGDGRAELIYVDPDGRLRGWYNGNVDLPWTSEINIGYGFADPNRVYRPASSACAIRPLEPRRAA